MDLTVDFDQNPELTKIAQELEGEIAEVMSQSAENIIHSTMGKKKN